MIEIVPAILVKSEDDLRQKLDSVKGLVKSVQLDICDGKFVPNVTLEVEKQLAIAKEYDFKLEAHLMVENPLEYIEKYGKDFDKITVHIETIKDATPLKKIRELGNVVSLGVIVTTPFERVLEYDSYVDEVLVLAIRRPGFSGEQFAPEALELISKIVDADKPVEVDGGVNMDTIADISKAGATMFNAASAIFKQDDKAKAIEELRNEANKGT